MFSRISFLWYGCFSLLYYTIALVIWLLEMALFAVWWNQEFLLYHPTYTTTNSEEGRQTPFNPKGFRTPAEMHPSLPFEDVYLKTDDGVTINGWLITQHESGTKPCILYLHGNAGNIGHRLPGLKELYLQIDCNIFIIDYRGLINKVLISLLSSHCTLNFLDTAIAVVLRVKLG